MITKERIEEIKESKRRVFQNKEMFEEWKDLLQYIDQQEEEIKTKNEIIRLHQLIENKHKKEIKP